MEDTVWVFVGVITMLIVLGILSGVIQNKYEDDIESTASSSLDRIIFHCDSVCNMPKGTYLSFSVDFVKGMLLTGEDNSVCVEQGDKKSCRKCACDVSAYKLNLTDAPFTAHTYECFYMRNLNNVTINCTG